MKRTVEEKICDLDSLIKIIHSYHKGKTVGLCHGVFDVIHSGHITYFQEAASKVDILVVSVTTDLFVNKGPNRPINAIAQRLLTLAGVEFIDYVVESNEPSAVDIIKNLHPDLYFKGRDYSQDLELHAKDYAGNLNSEKYEVKKYGGDIYFTTSKIRSSSSIINAMTKFSAQQLEVINHAKKFFSEHTLDRFVEEIKRKKISIIGEIISDEYIFTESLGKSGKHPIVAERELFRKTITGGIIPILETISSFISEENLQAISVVKDISIFSNLFLLKSVISDSEYTDIKKTRYINEKTNSFMYEMYEMSDQYVSPIVESRLTASLHHAKNNSDLLMVLDFGHGLITPDMRDTICTDFPMIALNVQKNAGNKGFNNVGKYKSASIVIMNGDEVELEFRQKNINLILAAPILHKKLSAKIVVITNGSSGLVLTDGKNTVEVPALHQGIILDRTGSGDTLFSIISIFSLVIDDLRVLGLLGNLAASYNLMNFANEKPITCKDLMRLVDYTLK
jgi:rfaE bifunctional protein nucleotidyltransferase chain/domain